MRRNNQEITDSEQTDPLHFTYESQQKAVISIFIVQRYFPFLLCGNL